MDRRLSIALILGLGVSLVLNVFAFGFVAGRHLGDGSPPPQKAQMRELRWADHPMHLGRDAHVLPHESRKKFRDTIRVKLPVMRASNREVRELYETLSTQMSSDEWDRAAIETTMEAISDAQSAQRKVLNVAFVEALEKLSPAERKLMLSAAQKRGDRKGRHHRRQKPEHEPEEERRD